nr:FAD-dependent monooxygenase [Treponemataceae bacterium]
MILECSITILPEDEKKSALIKKMVIAELARQGKISSGKKLNPDEITLVLKKKSIDARKGKVKFHLRYAVYIGEKPDLSDDGKFCPKWRNVELDKDGKALHTVLIVGSGPAGLFAALKLLEKGIKPVILERGCTTSKRKIDIANISRTGKVDENSNYCFGEGGAGTFSDGKLFTRSNKRGNIDGILQIFVYFGADPKILTDSHPHIGSDKLPKIVNSMVETIRKFGGEVHFETKVTDLILSESKDNLSGGSDVARLNVRGVRYVSLSDDKASECELFADAVILATGHSATDVYELLSRIESERKTADLEAALSARILEEKTFAVGVRVEHPREVIDKIQYHGKDRSENLPAAEYRLVTQVEGRGVYSFCMCPGGNVVPSQSGDGQIVVNGMSSSSRNSAWSN